MNYYLSVQSCNREENVKSLRVCFKEDFINWYVPEDQVEKYLANSSDKDKIHGVKGVLPMKSKQLNKALSDGFENNKYVVTLDDDYINSFKILENKKLEKVSLRNVIEDYIEKLENLPNIYLGGVSASTNPFYFDLKIKTHGHVTGGFLIHKYQKDLHFDENCLCHEDTDFVIQHHIFKEGVLKNNSFIVKFGIETTKNKKTLIGGYQGYRNNDLNIKILNYLEEKWKNYSNVKINKVGIGESSHKGTKWNKLKEKNEWFN